MKFLIIDDHALIRDALRGVLKEVHGDDAAIVEAANARQAMHELETHHDVDVVLLDLGLPDRDGFELLDEIGERHATVSIVVLSAQHDRETVTRALEQGVLGFIPKSASRDVMLSALRLIFSGGVYIPPEILARSSNPSSSDGTGQPRVQPTLKAADLGLTDRQMEVLALMMRGRSNKAICRILNVAEQTVKIHVSAILKALKAANRTEAVTMALRLGFTLPRDGE